jgi:adenylate kinase family enzyme
MRMRCIVVGTSGSGKSVFARTLSAAISAPYVELDRLYWGPHWTPRPLPELQQSIREAAAGDSWVVDGNYSALSKILWSRATHIVWLNFTRLVVFSRVALRTLKRTITRQELWAGNRESLRKALLSKDSILLWSLTTYSKNRLKYAQLRASPEYSHLQWHELRTPRQAVAFIREHASAA